MNPTSPTVFVVDDDEAMRRSLDRLLRSSGLTVRTFASAREFLEQGVDGPGCILLDVQMPKLSGLDLQAELATRGLHAPIVFLTGHGDIPMSVRAMKNGATDFLTKPFHAKDLLAAVRNAIERDQKQRQEHAELDSIRQRVSTLTDRELEVFQWIVTGALNKQIAAELGISERTVKVHRARVMQKMQVVSVAELTHLADKGALKTPPAAGPATPTTPRAVAPAIAQRSNSAFPAAGV